MVAKYPTHDDKKAFWRLPTLYKTAQQKAITDIKYDPSLPPLPEKARAALDDLVKARAYDRFRLSLIGGSS